MFDVGKLQDTMQDKAVIKHQEKTEDEPLVDEGKESVESVEPGGSP